MVAARALRTASIVQTCFLYRFSTLTTASLLLRVSSLPFTSQHPTPPNHVIKNTAFFSTTQCLHKKSSKSTPAHTTKSQPTPASQTDDPFDFTLLEAEIASTIERLKQDLSKLRSGGRFNPELLENLRVQPDKTSTTTVKLNDLAQVVPKGRTVQIFVGEKDHIKPITTAILTSRTLNPSLTPQPDPTGQNPLLLILNIPPPTTESRHAAVAEATKAGEKASTSVRDARGKQQKKLRALEKEKKARPDDVHKAQGMMEKIAEGAQGEVKKVVEGVKKVLESG